MSESPSLIDELETLRRQLAQARAENASLRASLTAARKENRFGEVRVIRRLQQTQKLDSLGVLAGGIAHRFNNLLTGVLGNATLAETQLAPGSPLRDLLREVRQSATRAAELCKQMLAYSGKGQFSLEPLDLNRLLADGRELLSQAVAPHLRLEIAPSAGPLTVSADAEQVRQLLLNLVSNASEAMGHGHGTVTVRTRAMTAGRAYLETAHLAQDIAPGEFAVLEVSDTGPGIAPEVRESLFDPFVTTKFTGRGLGLSAVLGIVRGHGGAIKVISAPGRGATFQVLVPRTPAGKRAPPLADRPR